MTARVEEVERGIQRIRLRSWQGRIAGYEVSAYVLDGVLVDTGFHHVRDEFLDAVRSVAPRGAVVTHWHEDHAGNVPALAALGLPLAMHPETEAALRARPAIRAYRRIVWGRTPMLSAHVTPFDAAPLRVISLPGHSHDHQVVWDESRRTLVSGDLFLGVKVRVAHEHEEPRRLLASLQAAIALEPRRLLDAHRGIVVDATAALRAKASWLAETIEDIETMAARGVRARAIARRVLGREELVGWVSRGEYSKRAFVDAVLAERVATSYPPSDRTSTAPSGL